MKIFFGLPLLAIALAASSAMHSQASQAPFILTLSSTKKVINTALEARLEIVLRNTSDHEFSITKANTENQAETQYTIDVRDGRGHPVALSEHGRIRLNRSPTSRLTISEVVYSVKPGETLTDVAVVTELYDLSQPGKYTIRVSREIPREFGKGTVKSNPVTITVTK